MPINSLKAQTRSIAIAAGTDTVFDLVADPAQLPRWAPGAARTARQDGDHWILENEGGESRIQLRASREHGTADFLSADDPRQGVFSRVLPNGEGSEYQFTMLFPADLPEEAVAAQLTIIESELQTVRALCEPLDSETTEGELTTSS
jgi:uncharacterized protein YndB with AHSA1/START domain